MLQYISPLFQRLYVEDLLQSFEKVGKFSINSRSFQMPWMNIILESIVPKGQYLDIIGPFLKPFAVEKKGLNVNHIEI